MEIDELHNKVNDPQVAQLLDKILDAVLALKARLMDSNMDSNSIGGISIYATSARENAGWNRSPGDWRGTRAAVATQVPAESLSTVPV